MSESGMRTKHLDLDAIRARADKATPGPWFPVVNDLVGGWAASTVNAPLSHGRAITPADFLSLENADFVAHARDDIPALLAEIERLREALAEIAAQQPNTLAMIERNGFVFDSLGHEPGNWQHLAFTIYTDLCRVDTVARAALAAQESAEREEENMT